MRDRDRYVVSAELPKVSYLTTMDYFVNVNLLIQFSIAVLSWVTTGVFFTMSNATAATVNLAAFIIGLVALFISCVWLLILPAIKEALSKGTDWPASLGREVPEVRYYPLEYFKGVFPPWQPGTKNPIALPPKTSGAAELSA